MTDQELLQAMSEMMDKKLEPINKRLDGIDTHLESIDERLDHLEEEAEITRAGVNTLLAWAEDCGNVIKFPLPKIADAK